MSTSCFIHLENYKNTNLEILKAKDNTCCLNVYNERDFTDIFMNEKQLLELQKKINTYCKTFKIGDKEEKQNEQ